MRAAEGGGFGSIAEVRALFANDSALAAGWLHYLAFDLFVGAWIAREGPGLGRPRLAADPLPRPHLPVRPGRSFAVPDPPLRVQPPHRRWRLNRWPAWLRRPSRALPSRLLAELLDRQRTLALYGIALLITAVPLVVLQSGRSAPAPRGQRLGQAGQIPRLGRRLLAHRGMVLRLCPAGAAWTRPRCARRSGC